MYPKYANIGGEKKALNTSYKTALRCFETIQNPRISDYERCLGVIYMLFGEIPKADMVQEYFEKAVYYLQCGQTKAEQDSKPADMDFNYDRKYINASFMYAYGINLEETDLHFWQYIELIEGLPNDCILSQVRNIRTCDVKDYAEKDRAKIKQLKRELALPIRFTQEEQEASDEFERLLGGE